MDSHVITIAILELRIGVGLLLAMALLSPKDNELHGVMPRPQDPQSLFEGFMLCLLLPEVVGIMLLAAVLVRLRR